MTTGLLHTEKEYLVKLKENTFNTTDVVYQDVQLYIEGVQVPYSSISVSQSIGNIPSAVVEVPPSPGLMDIAKYYQPKVHIFYNDEAAGGQRLLFWGHINSCDYSMTTRSNSISFNCIHKNTLLNQVTMDFRGYAQADTNFANANENNSVFKATDFGSSLSLLMAMEGITGVRPEPSTDNLIYQISVENKDNVLNVDRKLLDYSLKDLSKRIIGIPSAMMNLWNQMKMATYSKEEYNTILSKMYIPLLEDGLAFFKRTSGHPYIETMIQNGKYDACIGPGKSPSEQMVPPAYRLNLISSVQASFSLAAIEAGMSYTGETTGFLKLFNEFFYSIDYEVLTLASPASVPVDPAVTEVGNDMMAIETIIKPQMPFYFSPICNVLLPRMYSAIQVSQNDSSIPTRVDTVYEPQQGTNVIGITYRGPASIRESVIQGVQMSTSSESTVNDLSLSGTTSFSYNIPGKYELGSGFRPKRLAMPQWLSRMVKSKQEDSESSASSETWPNKNTIADQILKDLHSAWIDRYGYITVDGKRTRDTSKDSLNPFGKKSNVKAFERLMFSHADYDFTKEAISSRTGSVSAVFNPYIIPGYPMDIVAKTPNQPSFHALCASVTHSITPSSISTSISFLAASTYSELSNYHVFPAHPWLQTALNIVNVERDNGTDPDSSEVSTDNNAVNTGAPETTSSTTDNTPFTGPTGKVLSVQSTLINNIKAKETADTFYRSVLGVGATSPSDLMEFKNMSLSSLTRSRDGLLTPNGVSTKIPLNNGGEGNDNLTTMGNFRLLHRLIESKANIQEKFGYTFIDLQPELYSPKATALREDQLSSDSLLEPGASMFLTYPEVKDFLKKA